MTEMFLLSEAIVDKTGQTPTNLRLRTRDVSRIDAAVLHQTAFSRGSNPDLYLNTVAHYVMLPDGTVVRLHPVEAYLAASSAFNDEAIAIEFVGNFASDRGTYFQPENFGRHHPTPQQIRSGRHLLRHLRDTYGIWFVHAHRQGEHPNRRANCPGPEIWYHIGEWAIANLRLSDGGAGYVEGQGSPIPASWRADPAGRF